MAGLPPSIARRKTNTPTQGGLLSKEIKLPFFKEVPDKEVIEFTRNLAVMLKAKLTLLKSLETCIEQTSHKRFTEILKDVHKQVRKGKSLSQAISTYSQVFDGIFIQLSRVGELSGALDEVLLRLSGYKEKAYKLKQSIKMALVYPAIIISVAVLAVTFLLLFVVPTFVDMYQDFDAQLPAPTQLLLSMSKFLTQFSLPILGGLMVSVFLVQRYFKTEKGELAKDKVKLSIPYFGEMYKKGLIGQFTNTLSTLLGSGVNLAEGLKVLRDSSENVILRDEIGLMLSSIKKGKSLNKSLSNSRIFPIMVTQMINVGEETASLDEMLRQVAKLYEDEVDLMVEGLTSVIEPILIVFIGLIIGAIIVALYLPIFEMVNVIG